ncbi:MAG: hypothetical protein ACRD6X_03780, partial [Pyrinomonadaceae bacterium]
MIIEQSMSLSQQTKTRVIKWIAIWVVWTLFALFFASQLALQMQFSKNAVPLSKILSWQLVSGYVWFALTPLILFLARRFPFDMGRWKVSLSIHIVTGLLIALFQQSIDATLLPRLGYPPGMEFESFWAAYKLFVSFNLHLSLLIYWGT